MPRESAERRFLKNRISVNATALDAMLAQIVQGEAKLEEDRRQAQALQAAIESDQGILDDAAAERRGGSPPETIGDQIGQSAADEQKET